MQRKARQGQSGKNTGNDHRNAAAMIAVRGGCRREDCEGGPCYIALQGRPTALGWGLTGAVVMGPSSWVPRREGSWINTEAKCGSALSLIPSLCLY